MSACVAVVALALAAGLVVRSSDPSSANALPAGLSLVDFSLGPWGDPFGAERTDVAERYGKLPLSFEENRGQSDGQVDYLARASGQTVFLSSTGATLALRGGKGRPRSAVRLSLEGADPHSRASGLARRAGTVNYLKGERSQWRRAIPTYARVRYDSVYPGIDLAWYGTSGGSLEYDFLIAPGADPSRIALGIEGARRVKLARDGSLRIETAGGVLAQRPPVAYQRVEGKRRKVKSGYRLDGDSVSIALGRYDRSRQLVIDPVLAYSTFLGGSGADFGGDIAVDPAGSAYLIGGTTSTNFPTESPVQATHAGEDDVIVAKLAPDGQSLVYSTYLGGSDLDEGHGIAVDRAGSAYLTGEASSTNFPTQSPFQGTLGGGFYDAFVAKLSPDGQSLVYSSYLGGSDDDDDGTEIAVDAGGSAYLTGRTSSDDFPTQSPFQGTIGSSTSADAFAAKLAPDGSLAYSTYVGGSSSDEGDAIAVDAGGSAYLMGRTSSDFPTQSPLQAMPGGGTEAFVAKLAPDGQSLAYSTYLGGSGNEDGGGIAVDPAGSAYLAGLTVSTDFPTQSPLQGVYGGGTCDAFAAKLAPGGQSLAYSTYLGGSGCDSGDEIAVDPGGSAYLTGLTRSTNFPTQIPLQGTPGGDDDGFAAKLAADGRSLAYSTYVGGSDEDRAFGVAVDAGGSAYLTGLTLSADFPTQRPLQGALVSAGGGRDAFAAKLAAQGDLRVATSDPPDPVAVGAQLSYSVTVTNDGPDSSLGVRLVDTLPSGAEILSAQASQASERSCDAPAGGRVSCSLGALAAGASASVTISVRPESAGSITNTAEISADTPDPDPRDNQAREQTTVSADSGPGEDDEAQEPPADRPGEGAAAGASDSADQGQLPFTGLTLAIVAYLGAALLTAGAALRQRTRPRP